MEIRWRNPRKQLSPGTMKLLGQDTTSVSGALVADTCEDARERRPDAIVPRNNKLVHDINQKSKPRDCPSLNVDRPQQCAKPGGGGRQQSSYCCHDTTAHERKQEGIVGKIVAPAQRMGQRHFTE
ncbi:hypothetical protein J6590_035298 [Homalodisca vitripennis]|nr:hypothetical protein J6590_035298 [Homalodisca vitripennis]